MKKDKVTIKRTDNKHDEGEKSLLLNIFENNKGGSPLNLDANIEFAKYKEFDYVDVCTWFSTSREGDECQQINVSITKKQLKKYIKALKKFAKDLK
jgi:hypothetical protein